MFSLDPNRRHYTPDQYLEREELADYKSEYYHGEIFAMVGATRTHNRIAMNIASLLTLQLDGKPCEPFSSDMKVAVGDATAYFYPDLSVACAPSFMDAKETILTNPVLVIEIISPSTEAFDRGKKFAAYALIPSLTDYMLVSQDEPRIEYNRRQPDGGWLMHATMGIDAVVVSSTIGCRLALSDVYKRVVFGSSA